MLAKLLGPKFPATVLDLVILFKGITLCKSDYKVIQSTLGFGVSVKLFVFYGHMFDPNIGQKFVLHNFSKNKTENSYSPIGYAINDPWPL